MKPDIEYIFVKEADINEGLTSGTISKASIYFTKEYFFIIPFESEHIWKTSNTDYTNTKEFIEFINTYIENFSINEFQNKCIDFLPNERVYNIDALEKFSMQVGFSIIGGMKMKKYGEQVQVANIQPKSLRSKIKKFYKL